MSNREDQRVYLRPGEDCMEVVIVEDGEVVHVRKIPDKMVGNWVSTLFTYHEMILREKGYYERDYTVT